MIDPSKNSFKRLPQLHLAKACVEAMEIRRLLSTTFYVSPTGNDANAGTSPSTPWQTVAKVNSSTFNPGDSILFQYGSQFRASLTVPSSGTTTSPITFGAYGDNTLSNPEFIGSDVLNNTAFTLASGTTYTLTSATPINWVYDNDQFMRESEDVLIQDGSTLSSDPATNISYVEGNTGFFYYDANTTTLYLNRGGSLSEQVIEASTRQDAISTNVQSNLIISNLDVTQTAADNGGYGVRVENSDNIQLSNVTASFTGKHAIGVIDSTAFVGTNLTADQSAPDQGFGGASAFVAYSDLNVSGTTSKWINCTYTNPDGAYEIFVSHGDPGAISSIELQNLVSLGGYGTGIDIQSSGSSERVTIQGGEIGGGEIDLSADDSFINGVTIDQNNAAIDLFGTGDVVQNCLFSSVGYDIDSGHDGAVVDDGTNNIIRFNTFSFTSGPAIFVNSATSNTSIYGNIFDAVYAICLNFDTTGTLTSSDNVITPGTQFIVGGVSNPNNINLTQWQSLGYDTTSVSASPGFADKIDGNYQLSAGSPAIDLYKGTPDQTVATLTTDYAGNPRPMGAGYDAGAYEFDIPITGSVSVSNVSLAAPLAGTAAPAVFTVTLSAAQTGPTTVAYTTVDGTALAGTDYTATAGTLTFAAGVTSQTVSVPVAPTLTANSSKTFQLTLSSPSSGITLSTAAATATATVSNANETSVAFNKKSPAVYTDSLGNKVTLKLGGLGSGTALFVTGNADPVQILLTGTTAASSFSVTALKSITTVENILVQGSIGSITTTSTVAGSLDITGTISHLTLGSVAATLTLESAADHPAIKLGALTDGGITSASAIASLSATSWSGAIIAPSIGTLTVKGAFAGNLTLSSGAVALSSAKLGSITSGTWAITGVTSTVSTASISAWTAAFTGGIKTLKSTGAVTNSTVRSAGNIGAISVGAALNSIFFAGVNSTLTTLPITASDFTGSNQIASFTITAPKSFASAFSNSLVAASKITTAKVQRVQTANNSTPFGFATQTLGSFTDIETGKKTFSWTSRKSNSLLSFAGDFKVSLI